MYQTLNYRINIRGLNWGNRLAQTRTEPARSGFSWNRYNRNGPKTEPLLTLDTITTQILNWSWSTEFAKMRPCCMINLAKQPQVYVWSRYQPRQDRAVQFFGRVWNQTKPFFQSKPWPVANTSQWRVCDFCSCNYSDWTEIWSLLCITYVLAAFIGKTDSNTVTAPFWEWVSTECQ